MALVLLGAAAPADAACARQALSFEAQYCAIEAYLPLAEQRLAAAQAAFAQAKAPEQAALKTSTAAAAKLRDTACGLMEGSRVFIDFNCLLGLTRAEQTPAENSKQTMPFCNGAALAGDPDVCAAMAYMRDDHTWTELTKRLMQQLPPADEAKMKAREATWLRARDSLCMIAQSRRGYVDLTCAMRMTEAETAKLRATYGIGATAVAATGAHGCVIFGASTLKTCQVYADWTAGSWMPPAGVTVLHVLVVGGGGGGGATIQQGIGGAGGGSGAVLVDTVRPDGAAIGVRIGVPGKGGEGFGQAGGFGGPSAFGGLTAAGGSGGMDYAGGTDLPMGGSALSKLAGFNGGGGAGGGSYQPGYHAGDGGDGGTGGADGIAGDAGTDADNPVSGTPGGPGRPFPLLDFNDIAASAGPGGDGGPYGGGVTGYGGGGGGGGGGVLLNLTTCSTPASDGDGNILPGAQAGVKTIRYDVPAMTTMGGATAGAGGGGEGFGAGGGGGGNYTLGAHGGSGAPGLVYVEW